MTVGWNRVEIGVRKPSEEFGYGSSSSSLLFCVRVTTGNNPTGVPDVRALILVPGGKTEPQTKPYPLDMWKYGSALQQRPEDRSLYGRGATIKTLHPEPSLKPFLGILNRGGGVKPIPQYSNNSTVSR
uniref:Retrotransposon protein, putative, Ty3-gypsy subclass n=1 Tax=Oryza sativa subsp. japonica TaxID=39947 RepID=Q33A11_ORYSJ|nr:retrotransposon protein, putative, Ty3-gypsy subclass [Oryza sativa Japonica Group]